jgi:surface polysaccharide O-acyltransferase-like enzyme
VSVALQSELKAELRPAAPARQRLAMFDFARLVAIYGIVWLHTLRSPTLISWTVLGRFAVPFFAAGAAFFVIEGLRRQPTRALGEYAWGRVRRIYMPFLAWSGIYLVFKWVKSAVLPDQPNDFPGISALWTGTFFHLWFMPFVLLATLAVFVLGREVVKRPRTQWFACALLLAGGLACAIYDRPAFATADPGFTLLVWQASPAVCWGFAVALTVSTSGKSLFASRTVTACAAIAFFALIVWLAAFGRNTLIENLAGILFLIAALAPSAPDWIGRAGRFGSLAYGIYLAHMLVIKVLEAVATRERLTVSWLLDVVIFIAAALGSTLIAGLLARSPRTRWLAA